MNRTTRTLIAMAAAAGVGLGSYGIAAASSSSTTGQADDDDAGEVDDSDAPLSGSALDQAVAAALEHTGGGEVIETEIGDDGAAYGVEIRLPDGSQVEVNLDEAFTVIGSEVDD
jgi:uncharacterized membrane protein YkoI